MRMTDNNNHFIILNAATCSFFFELILFGLRHSVLASVLGPGWERQLADGGPVHERTRAGDRRKPRPRPVNAGPDEATRADSPRGRQML